MINPDLQRILDRCFVDPESDCWIWRGCCAKNKTPRIHCSDYNLDSTGKTKVVRNGAKAAWYAASQKPIPQGHIIYSKCFEPQCVNPQHHECGPRGKWGKVVSKSGKWKNQTKRKSANRANGIKRAGATQRQVREIVFSPEEKIKDLGERLGVSENVVRSVRKLRRVYAATAIAEDNLWAGLLK